MENIYQKPEMEGGDLRNVGKFLTLKELVVNNRHIIFTYDNDNSSNKKQQKLSPGLI